MSEVSDRLPFRSPGGWLQPHRETGALQLPLPSGPGLPGAAHLFERDHLHAVNAALATGRPLLVRGEPGVGKSQLARAVAVALGRRFVHQTVDSRTEPRDLLFHRDEVARLAAAQVMSVPGVAAADKPLAALDVRKFTRPGALWWALDPSSAQTWVNDHPPPLQEGSDTVEGGGVCLFTPPELAPQFETVVLVDEIDKADPSVPSALLDALGQGGFTVPGVGRVPKTPPGGGSEGGPSSPLARLIVFTTNNQRELPDAFLRRCLVLRLKVGEPLEPWLRERGRVAFPELPTEPGSVLTEAASMVVRVRGLYASHVAAKPGLAEYLDLVRAWTALKAADVPDEALQDVLLRIALDKRRSSVLP